MTQINTEGLGPAGLLIAKGWTKGAFARNYMGNSVEPDHMSACSWCSHGAISGAYPKISHRCEAAKKLSVVIKSGMVAHWNDAPERTHEEVIEAFRKAGI